MARNTSKILLYGAVLFVGLLLGMTYLLRYSKLSALSGASGTQLSEAQSNSADSEMCTPTEENSGMFFISCGGIY